MEARITLEVGTVMAGQVLVRADGTEVLCPADLVQVQQRIGDRLAGSMEFTPEQALQFARTITSSATELINAEIDNDGNKVSFLHRVQRVLGEGPRS